MRQMGSWGKCHSCVNINPESLTNFLITVDQIERVESCYLCEVLHFLLRKRYGIPLVKLGIDLVDKDNEAVLDLLCVLFKHCKCYERIVMHICTDHPLWSNVGIMSQYLMHNMPSTYDTIHLIPMNLCPNTTAATIWSVMHSNYFCDVLQIMYVAVLDWNRMTFHCMFWT